MDKKLEYHKKYSEAAYKDRVYKWFNDNTSTLDDADLQKFVNDAMHGNLTFQCADEIDIDDPDISMIDNLLMDIASEKNDELINTYTDEIDWDNNYIEKYNRNINNMDKKLEARVARLEKLFFNKLSKNETRFIRRVDPNKSVKFNQDDFADVDSITLYVDGDDVDSISTAGYGTLEVLKRLMVELASYIKSSVKGVKNSEHYVWLEFNDINESVIYKCDLPIIYTDSMGRIEIEHTPRRGLNSVDKLCLSMHDKYCLV